MTQDILFNVSERIATITLNRPEKLNAFTGEMLTGLIAAIDECQAREDVSVVILTGKGRGFCSGGDVGGMGSDADNRPHITKDRIWNEIQAFPKRVANFDKPLIAAVNGAAVGGGMDLALACDFRTAATSARFAETYAKIGLAPGGGGAYFLPRLVGKAMALELLLTADFIDAQEALRIGLVNHVFDDDALLDQTRTIATRIAKLPPLSVQLIKRAVNQGLNTDMTTAFDLISSHIAIVRAGEDHPEAIRAFKEKRDGAFVGF
ncbi:MAG: enoyl-CoA hydratase/carnithine racemase [Gammaproteobacteria bacterium]|jgi:enoyl-CoA hydratase/carnithine racemase